MQLKCKKRRQLTRCESGYRDDRLFIVATEDTHIAEAYFALFRNPRIHVRVLKTEAGLSSPAHVLERLTVYKDEYEHIDEDEFWLVLDTDHWIEPNHIHNFTDVCTQALQKGYLLAHSNPCFEIWLFLHLADISDHDHFGCCGDVEARLKTPELLGEYNKRTVDREYFTIDSVKTAVVRAKKLDADSNDRWPQATGSHLYKLVEKIVS